MGRPRSRACGTFPALAKVPIIFLTAHALPAEIQALLALDVAAVLAKPFDPMALLPKVREICHSAGSRCVRVAAPAAAVDAQSPATIHSRRCRADANSRINWASALPKEHQSIIAAAASALTSCMELPRFSARPEIGAAAGRVNADLKALIRGEQPANHVLPAVRAWSNFWKEPQREAWSAQRLSARVDADSGATHRARADSGRVEGINDVHARAKRRRLSEAGHGERARAERPARAVLHGRCADGRRAGCCESSADPRAMARLRPGTRSEKAVAGRWHDSRLRCCRSSVQERSRTNWRCGARA